jgi:hypothetical protein
MGGYLARDGWAQGSHDPLRASAVVFDVSGTRAAIVALDLVAVTADLAARVRRRLADGGFKPELVMIAATHTHSGPGGHHLGLVTGRAYYSPQVAAEIVRATIAAVHQASARAVAASVVFGVRPVEGVAANRFFGHPRAPSLATLIVVRDARGSLLGTIVGYGVHPTVLGKDNLLYSADLVSGLRGAIDDELGRAPLVFLQAAGADLSTRGIRRGPTFDEAERLGRSLGRQALDRLADLTVVATDPVAGKQVNLDVLPRPLPGPAEAARLSTGLRQRLDRIQSTGGPPVDVKTAAEDLLGATEVDGLRRRVAGRRFRLPVQAIRVGELAFVGVGAELFSELGEEVRRAAARVHVVLATCANAYLSYVLPDLAVGAERYEALVSWVARDTGSRVVGCAREVLSSVSSAAPSD